MADGHGSKRGNHGVHGHGTPRKKTSREKATGISKYLTFWWLNPLLTRGFKKSLQASDLDELISLDELGIEEKTHELQVNWNKEVTQHKDQGREPWLLRAIARTYGLKYGLLLLLAVLVDGLAIAQPLFLKKLIKFFSGYQMTETEAYLYALAVSLCTITSLFLNTPYYYLRKMTGLNAKEGCITLIYSKILKLSPSSFSKIPNLNIANLVSSDVAKVDTAFFYLHYLILGPIEAIIVTVLLWQEIGVSCLAGMGLLFLLVPMQIGMSNFIMNLRNQAAQVMDQRVKVMREIISGIRPIKMYAHEPFTRALISMIRKAEIGWLKRLSKGKSLFTSIFYSSPALISFLSFMTYALTGHTLYASSVFTCVSLFNSALLLLEELCPKCQGLEQSDERPKEEECSLVANGISAYWSKDLPKPTIDNLSFAVSQGRMLAVIGEIGSGKTSLLQAILGELPLSQGTLKIKGKLAYTSQTPWVFNSSVRNNIIFDNEFDEQRYNDVVHACALDKDISMFYDGDKTLVGERGVSLSGGQRARISLARALYSDADIYLLDDPLSAVDIHIGMHLYKNCIMGYLSRKARILVTHQFRYVKEADHIIAMSEGECVSRGTFDQVRLAGIDLVAICPHTTVEEEEEMRDIQASAAHSLHHENLSVLNRRKRADSLASSVSAALSQGGKVFPNMEMTHLLTGTIEDTEGDVVAPQVEIYEDNGLPGETKHEGAVAIATYIQYFKSLHSIPASLFVLLLFVIAQTLSMLCDWWLSYWTDLDQDSVKKAKPIPDRDTMIGVYAGLTFGLFFLTLVRSTVFYELCLVASRNLHSKMFDAMMRAPVCFFDMNSIGRILNRFSKDTSYLDESLPTTLMNFLQTAMTTLGVVVLVGANNPISFAIVLPVFIVFTIERFYYVRTARDLKRLDGITRSPLYGHFSTTLLGLDTIRAFGAQDSAVHHFHHHLESNTRALFAYISVSSWLTFRLEILSAIFVSFVALISPLLRSSLTPGLVGLILTYATKLSSVLAKSIKKGTEVESMMTAVERLIEYCDLEPEAPNETDTKPPKGWPDKGEVVFKNVYFSHREDLPPVLKDVSVHIKPAEKVGIVGRTGAGKSSLLATLFRMAEPKGKIEIDGVDITKLGLRDLRTSIAIIPQEPLLFSSTLRRNMNPEQNNDDSEIWGVLEEVQLKNYVAQLPQGLDTCIDAGSMMFSVGQRQLICLARAILHRTKVVVIDEATANVDSMTSKIIWGAINRRFRDCTLIVIAHRLFPVMDADVIIVLDAGRIRELDTPYNLLQDPHSHLTHMVIDTGAYEERKLRELAKTSHMEKTRTVTDDRKSGEKAVNNECLKSDGGDERSEKDGKKTDTDKGLKNYGEYVQDNLPSIKIKRGDDESEKDTQNTHF
ncbi:ATP-binding cassette sub-family C member 4 isoform X2 [Nematostella vectensis]|uniref:ATP-binding cassette sub-family C member 4 isoform X2 n=1 Tax=Nematostella vectensis TaxID=45351 RepID=UPI0020774142|nr:ATP-binding cassette sub-family C member 4 isoform X2 [Nematostella vectensis]